MTTFQEKIILLTFDVEDWFQVENFKHYIPYSSWDTLESRVENNTLELLDLLDNGSAQVRATFFVLGWIAERYQDLIYEICRRGHEVASHGYDHHLCYCQTPDELRRDLRQSKETLEDLVGCEVIGYRAPSFSITDDALCMVKEAGYLYDSSYNSFQGNGRYGSLKLLTKKKPDRPIYSLTSSFYEIPLSNLWFGNKIIPWGGGGYFRLLPLMLHRVGVNHILRKNGCYTFYMHPWEIDPDQPRVRNANAFYRFRHYVNLDKAKSKLKKFIELNMGCSYMTCRQFVNKGHKDLFYNDAYSERGFH